jgi:hypothetical protein
MTFAEGSASDPPQVSAGRSAWATSAIGIDGLASSSRRTVEAAARTPDHSGSASCRANSSCRASNASGSTAFHSCRLLAHRSMTR